MRNNQRSIGGEEDDNEINLTPMLDVVFIMLIFFIVTASFIKEAGVDVRRPLAATTEKQADANILIAISSSNEIWIDKKLVDTREIGLNIERLHAKNPKGSIVIQADEESTNEMLTAVMVAAKKAGVVNVAISTREF